MREKPAPKPIRPEHQFWRRRVEGQIRHAMNEHPEWFNLENDEVRERCVRSVAKRIIGEIVAGISAGDERGRPGGMMAAPAPVSGVIGEHPDAPPVAGGMMAAGHRDNLVSGEMSIAADPDPDATCEVSGDSVEAVAESSTRRPGRTDGSSTVGPPANIDDEVNNTGENHAQESR